MEKNHREVERGESGQAPWSGKAPCEDGGRTGRKRAGGKGTSRFRAEGKARAKALRLERAGPFGRTVKRTVSVKQGGRKERGTGPRPAEVAGGQAAGAGASKLS